IGEGAILHAPPSFLKTHRRPGLGQFKRIAADVDAGLDQRLVVSPPGAEIGIAVVVFSDGEGFGGFMDQQGKLHQFSPIAQLPEGFDAPNRMTDENRSIRQILKNPQKLQAGIGENALEVIDSRTGSLVDLVGIEPTTFPACWVALHLRARPSTVESRKKEC